MYPTGFGEAIPVALVLLFVAFSCIGLLSIPWTMTAELYSDHLRDAGQAVTILIAYLLMFLGLQLYPFLESFLGKLTCGIHHIENTTRATRM